MSEKPSKQSLDVPTQPTPIRMPGQAPGAMLVILRGAQAGESIPLLPGVNLFGREEGFILKDNRISRRHFQIQDIAGEYMLVDLHSTNGTFVNGTQVTHPVLLQHGDMIRLGDTLVTIKFASSGDQGPTPVGARTSEPKTTELGGTTILVSRLNANPLTHSNQTNRTDDLDRKPPSREPT